MTETCKTCRWSRTRPEQEKVWDWQRQTVGYKSDQYIAVEKTRCHVHAPYPGGFPVVQHDDFCGEWKAKAEATSGRVDAAQISGFGWQLWNGGECPVDGDTTVRVKFADESIPIWRDYAAGIRWLHLGNACDVIAYSIVPAYELKGRGA